MYVCMYVCVYVCVFGPESIRMDNKEEHKLKQQLFVHHLRKGRPKKMQSQHPMVSTYQWFHPIRHSVLVLRPGLLRGCLDGIERLQDWAIVHRLSGRCRVSIAATSPVSKREGDRWKTETMEKPGRKISTLHRI